MSSNHGNRDVNYHRISEITPDLPNSPTHEAADLPKPNAVRVSTFELDVANAFELETFHNNFGASLYEASLHSAEVSEKLLFPSKTIETEQKTKTFFGRNFTGWRGGIAINATIASCVLLFNAVFLVWAVAKYGSESWLTTIFEGNCTKARNLSIVAHLIINILSTLLLGASNYAMQVASSPARADIDRAHKKQKCYNSVLSYSLPVLGNGPVVLYVTPEYFTDPASAHTPPPYIEGISRNETEAYEWNGTEFPALAAKVRMNATLGQLKQVGITECNKTQASFFQSNYESIVFVQTSVTSENSSLIEMGYYGTNADMGDLSSASVFITPYGYAPTNNYTLTDCWVGASEGVDCRLLLNSSLMLGVVVANTIKCCVMIFMVLRFTKPSLVTLGDAVASFLAAEDSTTADLRNTEKCTICHEDWVMPEAVTYVRKQKRWGSSLSRLRWTFSIIICVSFLAAAAGMLAWGLNSIGSSYREYNHENSYGSESWSIWSMGFGTEVKSSISKIDKGVTSLFSTDQNPISIILLANTPQIILSIGYILINNLLTSMLGAFEWSKIGLTKIKLRTTVPRGQQRSTYFLQLPLKYSLPLMLVAGTLHYLLSESLFVVGLQSYSFDTNGNLKDSVIPGETFGEWDLKYSPFAIIFSISLGVLLLGIPITLAFRKLYPGIPMAVSNSALISAACHPPAEEGDASLLPVQWGVVNALIDPNTGIGRCSISSGEVSEPIEGQLYH